MLAVWRRIREQLAGAIRSPASVRSRLLFAVAVAAAPGILFAAFEAQRQFTLATRAVAMERAAATHQLGAEVDAVLQGGFQLLEGLHGMEAVRDITTECSAVLRQALSAQRYSALARIDAQGMPRCYSLPPAAGRPSSVGNDGWFRALRDGAQTAVSEVRHSQFSGARILLLGRSEVRDGAFAGALAVGLNTEWLDSYLASRLPVRNGAVFVLDAKGQIVARARSRLDPTRAAEALRRAKARTLPGAPLQTRALGGLSVTSAPVRAEGLRLFLLQPRTEEAIGWRASLILISPLILCVLWLLAVWLALHYWVLRWHGRLAEEARAFSEGRTLAPLRGRPPLEIRAHLLAFASAVRRIRERETELAAAVETNLALSRELHHRVKNNLQILSSLASRQQRRIQNSAARKALSESRAYLLAISLIYRYLDGPEELGGIHLRPYLSELMQQLHLLLDRCGQEPVLDLAEARASADEVGAIGLIVAECCIVGSRAEPPIEGQPRIMWRGSSLQQPWRLELLLPGFKLSLSDIDLEMVQQLARQLKAEEVIIGAQGVRIGSATLPTLASQA